MLKPVWEKNDRKARNLIFLFSVALFAAIVLLSRVNIKADLGFDVHLFALANAIINSLVALSLIAALIAVKMKNYKLHRNIMLSALMLSVLFLLSYICHHLFAGDTKFGDVNHDEILSITEKENVGTRRVIYYFILGTHVPLAGIILPFILFSAYRGLTGEFAKHKKLARITWPIWFYVAVTGVLVYWMISPYYYS
jgi:putative membrane protein